MKIQAFTSPFRILSDVRSKRNEGEGGGGGNQYDPHQSRKDGQGGEEQNPHAPQQRLSRPESKDVDAAVAAFHADAATQASGLSAVVEGTGPGLRISVRDCNGTTLRQFSGEEFVRLRETNGKDARSRGKILDQKL